MKQANDIISGSMVLEQTKTALPPKAIEQNKANGIAQRIFKQDKFDESAKRRQLKQGEKSPQQIMLEELKSMGYEYKKVLQSELLPAHGVAVKIVESPSAQPTPVTPTEESFFTKNKKMILVGGGLAIVGIGAGVYFYMKTKNKK